MKRFSHAASLLLLTCLLIGCRNSAATPPANEPEPVPEEVGPTGIIYAINRPVDANQQIVRIDLAAGSESAEVIYTATDLAQIHELDVFPDGSQLVFAQTPSPSVNTGIFDRNLLSVIDLTVDNPEAELLLGGEVPNEFYNMPIVSPDGRYLFYSRLGPDRLGITGTDTFYGIERHDLETGEITPIVPNSIWPQLSPDGTKLSFIILDIPTQQRGLGIVNIDGSEPDLLIDIGRYFDIDSPIFSQDGQSIYLSIVEEQPQAALWERLLGINIAYAHTEHNIPSTWWELKLDDSEADPVPLNTPELILVNGRFHPSEPFMALSSAEGIKIWDLDADQQTYEGLNPSTTFGMLEWVASE